MCAALFFYLIMGEREITALFIGNGKNITIKPDTIEEAVIKAIDMGIRVFLNDGQGQFDRMSAVVVHRLKQHHPYIKTFLYLSYLTFADYDAALYDEIIYPFDRYMESYYTYIGNIGKRNKIMGDKSSLAIFYVPDTTGGAGKTLAYAKKKGLSIIDLNGGG